MSGENQGRPDVQLPLVDNDHNPVASFIPRVLKVINVVSPEGKPVKTLLLLSLKFQDGSDTECEVDLSTLDKVNWAGKDARCFLSRQNRGAKNFLADYIHIGMTNAEQSERVYLDRLGIHRIGDSVVFVAGDRVITPGAVTDSPPKYELAPSRFRLDIDETISVQDAVNEMLELVALSPEIGRLLLAHVISGIIRAAFKEAGFTPCTVLAVVGKSGMLKSSYVPQVAQLYNRLDGVAPDTRFNSTKRFIEDVLCEYRECTAVIDDLHTAKSGGIKRMNEDTAEEIIRRVADDTGRGRKDGHAQIQRKFGGNVVFIGEYMAGTGSTLPRALVLNITDRPDGAILDKFQRERKLLPSTFYWYFIQWYVDNYDEVGDYIARWLTEHRTSQQASQAKNMHLRFSDTEFYLGSSYLIFLDFCNEVGICTEAEAEDEYQDFNKSLQEQINLQQAGYTKAGLAEEIDYVRLIREYYDENKQRIAPDLENYQRGGYDGLIHNKCLCMPKSVLEGILEIKGFPYNRKDCIEQLRATGVLKPGSEKNTVQISALHGKRFYAIYLSKLRESWQ